GVIPRRCGGRPLGWSHMARCPLCESDVPDGRSACDVCGQPFDRRLTMRTTPEIAKRALAAARKDLVASGRDPDPSFARSLLERAEQTEAAGDLGRALDLARAVRRVLEIARRKARVADALAYADAVLDGAPKAGTRSPCGSTIESDRSPRRQSSTRTRSASMRARRRSWTAPRRTSTRLAGTA